MIRGNAQQHRGVQGDKNSLMGTCLVAWLGGKEAGGISTHKTAAPQVSKYNVWGWPQESTDTIWSPSGPYHNPDLSSLPRFSYSFPYCHAPASMSKDPQKEVMVLGWLMGMRAADIWSLPMVWAPPGSHLNHLVPLNPSHPKLQNKIVLGCKE